MNKKIKDVLKFPIRLTLFLKTRTNNFFTFYLCNLKPLIYKRIFFTKPINFTQKTFVTGQGKIFIGKNASFGYRLGGFFHRGIIELQPRYKNSVIRIGNNVSTNNNLFICCASRIDIGNDCLIGNLVTIRDFESHGIDPQYRRKIGPIGAVIIEDNVWIGNNVNILKNSKIGANSIVAAGAVVSGIFPANVIIGGVPAKVIKHL